MGRTWAGCGIAAVTVVTTPGDVLLAAHGELEERTKSGLARATAGAAEAAANSEKPIDVNSTSHLRDLAATAAGLFGWNQDKTTRDTYNTVVISPEQIERIRAAADASNFRQSPQLEGAPEPFPPRGSIGYDVKVTP